MDANQFIEIENKFLKQFLLRTAYFQNMRAKMYYPLCSQYHG